MSRPLTPEFLAAVTDHSALPPSGNEVAFLGRSNVGKSSLLNALVGKAMAKVSATPGRTQVLTSFRCAGGGALIDCPGYGYAKLGKEQRRAFVPMIEGYLREREALVMALLLVDGEIGPTESDLHMLAWLRETEVPVTVVATKRDKIRSTHRDRRRREVAEACQLDLGDVMWVSAEDRFGLPELRDRIRGWLDD